ncbi:chemotaxis protein, partial [Sphingomonas sp. FW199]
MAAAKSARVGQWARDERSVADRLRAYDWDGRLVAGAREVGELIGDRSIELGQSFWRHYLSLPAAEGIRGYYDEQRTAEAVMVSARYALVKYVNPLGDEWVQTARRYAADSHRAKMPLQALLAALAYAHGLTLQIIEEQIGDDKARMRWLAEVVQRMALIEANIMAGHLGERDATQTDAARREDARRFRDSIAELIDGTSGLGNRSRAQAHSVSA